MPEELILVDENDEMIGIIEKMEAHQCFYFQQSR